MSNRDEKNSKLAIYIAYGICFGLLGGTIISLMGMMFENNFIQIAGYGMGLSLGMMIAALVYSFQNRT